jgi:hypothetical protein
MTTVIEKPQSAPVSDTSSTDVVELFLAELQARRKSLQHLMHLVNQQAVQDSGAALGGARTASPKTCCMSTRRKCSHCPSAPNLRRNKLNKHHL